MHKLKFLLVFICGFISLCFADETLTITTYYPSPYGSYRQLTADQIAIGSAYRNPTYADGTLYVQGSVGIGTTSPASKLEIYQTTYGTGQITANITDAGSRTDFLSINSNNSVSGAGGAITFGNNQSLSVGSIGFAAIKGLLTDGSGNTRGDLAFSTRALVTDTALTERMRITFSGNVGIGTTAPTVQFERACPAGFSNVKAGNNQLGCIQTTVQGVTTWTAATNSCFSTYGGRLPIQAEWYIAATYCGITTTDDQWLSDARDALSAPGHYHTIGSVANYSTDPDSNTHSYRCWIPR